MRPPHLAVLAANFEPETNAGANRISALAEHFAEQNWRVTVITQLPNHPQNRIYPGWESTNTLNVEKTENLTIIRLSPWLVPKDKLHWRLLSELRFTLRALPLLWRLQADAYFSSSPYMFLGPAAAVVARLQKKVFAWDIRDLTWLYPRAAGKRTYGMEALLASLMKSTAQKADILSATTEGQLEYFGDLVRHKVFMPNGVTANRFSTLIRLASPFQSHRPSVMYAGLFGFTHQLEVILHAAQLVPEADFVCVGDGPEREALLVQSQAMNNVEFMPFQSFNDLVKLYGEADILVHHFRKSSVFETVQSAKVLEYMATGRPVVYASEGEAIKLLETHRIGIAARPEDPADLARAIRQ